LASSTLAKAPAQSDDHINGNVQLRLVRAQIAGKSAHGNLFSIRIHPLHRSHRRIKKLDVETYRNGRRLLCNYFGAVKRLSGAIGQSLNESLFKKLNQANSGTVTYPT
jgi:hypothetical protein